MRSLICKMANEVAHGVKKSCTTIAEDVSGMVGIARPVSEGGIGFDYRLAMGIPDYWIKTLKEKKDEEWQLGEIWHELLNRRRSEKHVGYAESHDQSLVGDQTIAFRLMDKDMYWHMSRDTQNHLVARGMAAQTDSAHHLQFVRRRVSQLHRQRVRSSGMGRLSAGREQLQLSLCPKAVVARR